MQIHAYADLGLDPQKKRLMEEEEWVYCVVSVIGEGGGWAHIYHQSFSQPVYIQLYNDDICICLLSVPPLAGCCVFRCREAKT